MSCCAWKCVPTVIFAGVDISKVLWVSIVTTDKFSVKFTKITSRINVSLTCNGPFWFFLLFWFSEMVVLSKVCKPDNFEPHDSLNLRFTNIQCLCLNFVGCESFLESNTSDILALYETNLKDLIDSSNIFVRGYLSLIRKDTLLKCIVINFKCIMINFRVYTNLSYFLLLTYSSPAHKTLAVISY